MELLFHFPRSLRLYDVLIAATLISTASEGTSSKPLIAAQGVLRLTEQMPQRNNACTLSSFKQTCLKDVCADLTMTAYVNQGIMMTLYIHHLHLKTPVGPYDSLPLPKGHFRLLVYFTCLFPTIISTRCLIFFTKKSLTLWIIQYGFSMMVRYLISLQRFDNS